MICPVCGTDGSEVVEARPTIDARQVRRRRWCVSPACATRFFTRELVDADPKYKVIPRNTTGSGGGTPPVAFQTPGVASGAGPPNTTGSVPNTRGSENQTPGVGSAQKGGGGVSGGEIGSEDPDPSPGVSDPPIRGRARVVAPPTYSAEFLAAWAVQGKHGNKFPAWRAWKRHRPPLDAVLASLAKWKATDGWARGFVPHFSTWINARAWEDDPTEDATSSVSRCPFHAKGNGDRKSFRPSPTCVDCKHLAAAAGTRTSEPTPIAALPPPPPAWTQAQRAESERIRTRRISVTDDSGEVLAVGEKTGATGG